MQRRAAETRQKIIDTAVKLFARDGYLETNIKAISRAADLTAGAFYYHFNSKEDLVLEIIAQGWSRIWAVIMGGLDETEPGLENVIATSMAQGALFASDELVWVAVQLNQAFAHLSHEGRDDLRDQFNIFVGKVAVNIRPTDLQKGVAPEDVGEMVWIMLQGSSHLPGSSDPTRGLKNWDFILRSIVPPKRLAYFQQTLADTAKRMEEDGRAGPGKKSE